jgi:hypothetical protein
MVLALARSCAAVMKACFADHPRAAFVRGIYVAQFCAVQNQ